MILLDTNVVSALMYLDREPKVCNWLNNQKVAELFLPSPVIFETCFGIARLPTGHRRRDLEQRYDIFFRTVVSGRIAEFDARSAAEAGEVHVIMVKASRDKQVVDSQIAGMARALGAIIATRNTKDFAGLGLTLVNPWTG